MNLVFHQQALGDFAVTLPLLRGLGPPTTLVAPWSRAHLAASLIDGLTPMDIELFEFTRLHAEGGPSTMSPAIRELFERATTILTFISQKGDAWSTNVTRIAPHAKLVHIEPRPPGGWGRHISSWHREQVEQQGLTLHAGKAGRWGDPKGPLVVHPGSGGVDKCWPVERFEGLFEELRGQGRAFRVIYGEAEAERWNGVTLRRWQDNYSAVACGSLDQLVDILSNASAYLGNDAGPTHLAAQLGLATVALFGPSDPTVWRPIGPAAIALQPDLPEPMDWLPVGAVIRALNDIGS